MSHKALFNAAIATDFRDSPNSSNARLHPPAAGRLAAASAMGVGGVPFLRLDDA
jgi:hypothetical protein